MPDPVFGLNQATAKETTTGFWKQFAYCYFCASIAFISFDLLKDYKNESNLIILIIVII